MRSLVEDSTTSPGFQFEEQPPNQTDLGDKGNKPEERTMLVRISVHRYRNHNAHRREIPAAAGLSPERNNMESERNEQEELDMNFPQKSGAAGSLRKKNEGTLVILIREQGWQRDNSKGAGVAASFTKSNRYMQCLATQRTILEPRELFVRCLHSLSLHYFISYKVQPSLLI